MRTSTFLLAAASLFDLSIAGYALEDDYMTDFYGGFEFFTDADPTNGNILVHVKSTTLLTIHRISQIRR